VRTEGAILTLDSAQNQFAFNLLRQLDYCTTCFNPNPKYPRRLCGGEKTAAAKGNLKCRRGNLAQRLFHIPDHRVRPLSNKLERYVQGFGSHPAHARGERTNLLYEGRNSLADRFLDIERDKQAHGQG